MATWYVATGVSGGDGSSGSPWNWDEMVSNETSFNAGDVVEIASGTHSSTAVLTLTIGNVHYKGTGGTRPIVQATATVTHLVNRSTNDKRLFENIEFQQNSQTISSGYLFYSPSVEFAVDCKFVCTDLATICCFITTTGEAIRCEAVGGIRGFNSARCTECCAHGQTSYIGFFTCGNLSRCVAYNCKYGGYNADADGCVFFDCTDRGFWPQTEDMLTNSIVDTYLGANNTEIVYDSLVETWSATPLWDINNTTLTADPFTDAVNGDFRLTAAAKQTNYSGKLYEILARLVNVPGITLDSDLVGPSSGAGISPAFLR